MKTLGTCLCAVCFAFLPVRTSEALILINEILADPPAGLSGDANRDGVRSASDDEFVEFVNSGFEPVSLSGWTFWDSIALRHTFSASALLPTDRFFLLFGGGTPSGFEAFEVSSTGSLSLNNSGDSLFLYNADGTLMDSVVYGSEGGRDTSLTRFPDAEGPFAKHTSVNELLFSPETTVDGEDHLAQASAVPEPNSIFLLGIALWGMGKKKIRACFLSGEIVSLNSPEKGNGDART